MAIATSLLHRSFKGAVGDFIFRTYNGKTVVSLRPVYKNETNTEARLKARSRFKEAAGFASQAMENAKQKAYYAQKAKQLKLPNAYTAALTDFLRRAKAVAVTRSSFAAKKGDAVFIKLSKGVYKVNKIKVIAINRQGKVLHEQLLSMADSKRNFILHLPDDWPDLAQLKIISDEPGNADYILPQEEITRLPLR